jgi:hypothetical protein
MGDVPVKDRSVNLANAAAFVADLRAFGAESSNAEVAKLADDVEAAIPHIRYITKAELLEAHDVIIQRLNRYAAERTDVTIQYCVMLPPAKDALKSNMWVGLRTVKHCTGPAWGIAAFAGCKEDEDALQAYWYMVQPKGAGARPVEIHCLFFDDVMYTGMQMQKNVRTLVSVAPPALKPLISAYACVPFVHDQHVKIFDTIHPAILELVQAVSKTLPLARRYIRYVGHTATTLTYTQTKVPDYVSFPYWLARLKNPFDFLGLTDRPGLGLFHNCERPEDDCEAGSYVPVLRALGTSGRAPDICFPATVSSALKLLQSGDLLVPVLGSDSAMSAMEPTTLADGITPLTTTPVFDDLLAPSGVPDVYHWMIEMAEQGYCKIMLQLQDVPVPTIELFLNTVVKSLCALQFPYFTVLKQVLWVPGREPHLFSVQLLTAYKAWTTKNICTAKTLRAAGYVVSPTDLVYLKLAGPATAHDIHAAGFAHGGLADPGSYLYELSASDNSLVGLLPHPVLFTRVVFKDAVSPEQWRRAAAADARDGRYLPSALQALVPAPPLLWAVKPADDAVSTRHCNPVTQRLCSNFDTMRALGRAMGNVSVKNRSVDTKKAAAFVAELRAYGANPANANHAAVAELADDVQAALPFIRYITKAELLEAHDAIIQRLNRYAAERTDVTLQYCIMMPPYREALKSNMWVGLRVLSNCYGPAWGLAASFECHQDMDALFAYSFATTGAAAGAAAAPRPVVIHCLCFDDVMYSGGQMNHAMRLFQEALPRALPIRAYACVPFVHKHNADAFRYIHPAILPLVEMLARGLSLAKHYFNEQTLRTLTGFNEIGTTLTYAQTKVPDYASFPAWLARLMNPGTDAYKGWIREYIRDKSKRGGAMPLFRNCGDPAKSCMTGSYVSVLKGLQERTDDPRLADFCMEAAADDDLGMLFYMNDETMDQMADDGVVTIATTTHAPVALPNGVMVLQSTPMITSDLQHVVPAIYSWEGRMKTRASEAGFLNAVIVLSMPSVTLDEGARVMTTVRRGLRAYAAAEPLFSVFASVPWEAAKTPRLVTVHLLTAFRLTAGTTPFTVDNLGGKRFALGDSTTDISDFAGSVARKLHAAGVAHGSLHKLSSYLFVLYSAMDELFALHLHPASFTHVTFKDAVSDAEWRAAVAKDLRDAQGVQGAMRTVTAAPRAAATAPAKMFRPLRPGAQKIKKTVAAHDEDAPPTKKLFQG